MKDNYGVFLNGALAYKDDGSLLFERTVSSELAKQLLLFVQDRESMSINLCSYDKFYAMSLDRKYDLHLHEKYDDPKPCLLDSNKEFPSLHMIHVLGDPDMIDKIWVNVEKMCKKHGATLARNLPTDIAITHPNATKGYAVRGVGIFPHPHSYLNRLILQGTHSLSVNTNSNITNTGTGDLQVEETRHRETRLCDRRLRK